jgi:hypothetical protein
VASGVLARCARHGAAFVALLAMLAPLWLGPATLPLLRALAGDASHTCACGMAPGTCGCPECERLEHERQREHAPRPYRVLKSACDDQGAPLPSLAVPPCVMPATLALHDARITGLAPPALLAHDAARVPDGPPTPPPRAARL